MGWTLTEDVTQFLDAAGGFLRARPVEHTVLLTATESLRLHGPDAFGEVVPLLGSWTGPEGGIVAACLHTPPYGLALTGMPERAAAELAAAIADRGRFPSGLNGYATDCQAFADVWRARTGQPSRVQRRTRLHRLDRLRMPDPAPAGYARPATAADRDLLVTWMHAFHRDADLGSVRDPGRMVDDRLSYGGLTIWETDGEPVSMAGLNLMVAGQVRVGPVYTPAPLRRRGFGGGVTAAVSQAALDAGAGEVILFTDLANPTSNALYERLGFEPVSDRIELAFDPISY